jgi:uncharacterized glyoxalase superfamily protein PhnB
MSVAANSRTTIHPTMRYRDAPRAIDWLCNALGFERHAVYEDGEGGILHAQLVFGNGLIMISSARDDAWGQRITQPDQTDGRETQCCCLTVVDVDAHCARARAAGAEIIDEPEDKPYGGRGYGLRDPEGHLWWVGSYDPWSPPG